MRERVNTFLPFTIPDGHRGRLINHEIVDPDDGTIYYRSTNQSEITSPPSEIVEEDSDRQLRDFIRRIKEERDFKQVIEDSYLSMPKTLRFNDSDRDQLMQLAIDNEHVGDTEHNTLDKFNHLKIAGSSFIEVGLVTEDLDNARDDERIALVDRGVDCYIRAITLMEQKIIDNPRYMDYAVDTERAKVQLLFSNVYKDIITRDLTEDTVTETREGVQKLIDESSHFAHTYGFTEKQRRHHYGYGGELMSLLNIWNAYDKPGDTIAIPSTERGDSGVYRKAETHDIITMRQKRRYGRWGSYQTYEVKRRNVTQTMMERYMARIIAVIDADTATIHDSLYSEKNSPEDQAS